MRDAAPLDATRFHREELPARLAGERAAVVARATRGLASLCLRVGDGAVWTYVPSPDGLHIVEGDAGAATVLELDHGAWQGLVYELEAAAGLLYAGRVRSVRGRAIDLMAWEPGLRALYNGVPAYDPDALDLRDRHDRPLAVERTFTLGDDRDDMAHFLGTAGYLFVRNVLDGDEVARLRQDGETLRSEARPGDGFSWWGRNAGGDPVLVRVTRGATRPGFAALAADARVLRLVALADEPLVHARGEGDGATVIYKRPNVTEGLGDIPWHRDCGMGGHAVMCPILIASIYLTPATPETGELVMLPGSRASTFNAHAAVPERLRPAHFRAAPGDVSLHYGDTIHAAPPPAGAGLATYRTSVVLSFARPGARHHRGERSYNDALHRRDDGQVEHLERVADRT